MPFFSSSVVARNEEEMAPTLGAQLQLGLRKEGSQIGRFPAPCGGDRDGSAADK